MYYLFFLFIYTFIYLFIFYLFIYERNVTRLDVAKFHKEDLDFYKFSTNAFLKNNMCILKQIFQETQTWL